jgi:lysozyme family protein
MTRIRLTQKLKEEYQRLFETCVISDNRASKIESILTTINANRPRYLAVAERLRIPWYFIAVIHSLESSLRFDRHLHNGDPLSDRTIHVPKHRPPTGEPPFTWEESAADALQYRRMDAWRDWSLPGMLYKLEAYNGWGYRLYHPEVLSPYLWAGSNHYSKGKYVGDGQWSDTAASRQIGAATLLYRMAEKGIIDPSIIPVLPRGADHGDVVLRLAAGVDGV